MPYSLVNEIHADRVREIEASFRPRRARTTRASLRRLSRRAGSLPASRGAVMPLLPTRVN